MREDLEFRLSRLERRNRRLVLSNIAFAVAAAALVVSHCASYARSESTPTSIRVSSIEIIDRDGVVRTRIAGDLPDPIIKGVKYSRGDVASGVLLYDATGQERGGYITFRRSGNVALTLDGSEKQTSYFLAAPDGTTDLRIWRGSNILELRADEDGARYNAAANGLLVFQEPPFANPERTSMCSELRQARGQVTNEELMTACRERMSEAGCRACLGAL